jgi:hypothetical protein
MLITQLSPVCPVAQLGLLRCSELKISESVFAIPEFSPRAGSDATDAILCRGHRWVCWMLGQSGQWNAQALRPAMN